MTVNGLVNILNLMNTKKYIHKLVRVENDYKVYYNIFGVKMKKTSIIPIPVKKAMAQLGADLKDARIKRSLTMALIEERAGITHVTLSKVEKGDPTVSMGIYAKVMFVLGLIDNLYDLANPDKDELGRRFDRENLPKRVRYKKGQEV